jgi:hypothetical protein
VVETFSKKDMTAVRAIMPSSCGVSVTDDSGGAPQVISPVSTMMGRRAAAEKGICLSMSCRLLKPSPDLRRLSRDLSDLRPQAQLAASAAGRA